jgi:hypothetical protein
VAWPKIGAVFEIEPMVFAEFAGDACCPSLRYPPASLLQLQLGERRGEQQQRVNV